ncbi:MAG TPA: YidC/Oxa1 family insertase periplasmic-domain containing protein [Pyrinomonadaceae bacterium]|nr:YidC/Oxa1 family insertase periplasmic-domain containing protein [Pyrinomonadaceae bacterium]
MQQKRLIIALLISTAILFLWSYFAPVPPKSSQTPPAPSPQASSPQPSSTPTSNAVTTASPTPGAPPSPTVNLAPQRTLLIKTPLYEAKLDSHGAEAISWIIKKNKDSGQEIYSVAGNKKARVPLELVSPQGLKREPREAPLQLLTGDATIDGLLASSTYTVEGVDGGSGNIELSLAPDEKKRISFVLRDSSTGLDVVKTIVFDAANYSTDLEVTIKRGDKTIPQAKVRLGPSIGDQGVKHYSFYSVAPEAVAAIGDRVERHQPHAINVNTSSPDLMALPGPVDWAGVGDTYFSMVAVPSQRLEGLELRTTQYDYTGNGKPESRFLITAWVPVPTDGSRTVIYTGTKDHFLLTDANKTISQTIGRNIDLEGLIDYGWFSWMSRPLAVPILKAIKWLSRLTGSYGVAIILFTIVIYSLFFPLKWRSSKSMKKAQKLAPKMKELQEKIKGMKQNDPRLKELQVEQLRLMKEGNPLGGCLPLLIQMPFLFALYRAITISLDFRQATFLWLPDLSSGDPYHILEFLMAGTMIVLQLITPAPSADPLQRKMMAIGMPIFMLYVLWGAPSGLLLYWLVGNIVGFSQQFVINKWTNTDGGEPPPPEKPAKGGSKKRNGNPRTATA